MENFRERRGKGQSVNVALEAGQRPSRLALVALGGGGAAALGDFGTHEAIMGGATGLGGQAGASFGTSSFRDYLNSH